MILITGATGTPPSDRRGSPRGPLRDQEPRRSARIPGDAKNPALASSVNRNGPRGAVECGRARPSRSSTS